MIHINNATRYFCIQTRNESAAPCWFGWKEKGEQGLNLLSQQRFLVSVRFIFLHFKVDENQPQVYAEGDRHQAFLKNLGEK